MKKVKLPKEITLCKNSKGVYEKLGFTQIEEFNDFTYVATLPDNWSVGVVDNVTFCFDEKGRKRIRFYVDSTRAHGTVLCRFSLSLKEKEREDKSVEYTILLHDSGKPIGGIAWWPDDEVYASSIAKFTMDDNLPLWRNPLAYWDEEVTIPPLTRYHKKNKK